MVWWLDGSVGIEQFWWGILDQNNIHSFHLCMISGNRDEAWPMYHVWPISERFMLGRSGGTWPACCHWLNTGKVDGCCPIMFVLTQSYPCDTWFVCSTLGELAVSNLVQLLFCLSITWSRYHNAYRDLWIMTESADSHIKLSGSHRTQTQTSEVRWGELHASVVLSGHQHVCISNSQQAITEATKENLKWKTFTT